MSFNKIRQFISMSNAPNASALSAAHENAVVQLSTSDCISVSEQPPQFFLWVLSEVQKRSIAFTNGSALAQLGIFIRISGGVRL